MTDAESVAAVPLLADEHQESLLAPDALQHTEEEPLVRGRQSVKLPSRGLLSCGKRVHIDARFTKMMCAVCCHSGYMRRLVLMLPTCCAVQSVVTLACLPLPCWQYT